MEDVEVGSIRAWLRQVVGSIDDEGLKNLDWKPVVGNYLVQAKYLIVDFLNGKTDISNLQELEVLEAEIVELAEKTDVKQFPAYTPISRQKLLQDVEKINAALEPLRDGDKASFITDVQKSGFNLSLSIAPETIAELVTSEALKSTNVMILKVKKPDFLGDSQWEFKFDGRILPAKIADGAWLSEYQAGHVPINPGDAVRASVETVIRYGFDREVVGKEHTILKVLEVIPDPKGEQQRLL